jgi:GNAT superfamily N-acetyltransferase
MIVIRSARPADAATLPAIEVAAGALFRTIPEFAWVADEPPATAESILPLIAAGTVWIAEDGTTPAGELRADIWDDALHILALAVVPEFQRRGLGRRLLDTAAAEARVRGLAALTLTTFRTVPWNGPFYVRYGFVELDRLIGRLRETLRAETERGLRGRCAMRFAL